MCDALVGSELEHLWELLEIREHGCGDCPHVSICIDEVGGSSPTPKQCPIKFKGWRRRLHVAKVHADAGTISLGREQLDPADNQGVPIADADAAARKMQRLQAENERLRKALVEIAKGDGAFSCDPLEHAGNCIDNMKQIAEDALQKAIEVADVSGSEVTLLQSEVDRLQAIIDTYGEGDAADESYERRRRAMRDFEDGKWSPMQDVIDDIYGCDI